MYIRVIRCVIHDFVSWLHADGEAGKPQDDAKYAPLFLGTVYVYGMTYQDIVYTASACV